MNPEIILIDDDALVRMAWSYYARTKKRPLRAFASYPEFLQALPTIARNAQIYIDSHLGDGSRGEVISEEIARAGFSDLYLSTGYPPESLQKPAWIRAIIGKEPPF